MKKILTSLVIIVLVIYYTAEDCRGGWAKSLTHDYESCFYMELPKDLKVECHYSDIGGMSDGEKFTVFQLEAEPVDFIKDFHSKEVIMYDYFYWDKHEVNPADTIIRNISDIPEEVIPDWEKDYLWKFKQAYDQYGSPRTIFLYMIYFPDLMKLCMVYNKI